MLLGPVLRRMAPDLEVDVVEGLAVQARQELECAEVSSPVVQHLVARSQVPNPKNRQTQI